MRIVGGEARGRPLRAVKGAGTRPTADRVRQSLFDLLGQRMDGLLVLDLYAGTGALALEALSRGAAKAVLIEKEPQAFDVMFMNAEELGFSPRCTLLREDVGRELPRLRGQQFDLIFSDPPYAMHVAQSTIANLAANHLIAPGGRVVLEMGRREEMPACPGGLNVVDERRYGDTRVVVVRADGPA
jgi:16S rRNA (guanine(966)-N(2))-methyltransferase RsmD